MSCTFQISTTHGRGLTTTLLIKERERVIKIGALNLEIE